LLAWFIRDRLDMVHAEALWRCLGGAYREGNETGQPMDSGWPDRASGYGFRAGSDRESRQCHECSWGIIIGVLVCIGFVAPLEIGELIWEKIPFKLFMIRVGTQLVGLSVAGSILSVWR